MIFKGEGNWSISDKNVRFFIKQFPPHLRDEILSVLNQIKFLGRGDIEDGISEAISKVCRNDDPAFHIVPFTPSNGQQVRSAIKPIFEKNKFSDTVFLHASLSDALRESGDDDRIIFVHDHIASGTQAVAQLKAFMNELPDNERDPNIILEPLVDELRIKFRKMKFSFALIAVRDDGQNKIRIFRKD